MFETNVKVDALSTEVFTGRFLIVVLTLAGLLVVQHLFLTYAFPLTVLNYPLSLAVASLAVIVSSAIAFLYWLKATVPYGLSSIFGKVFSGVTLFLGFKAFGNLFETLSHFTGEPYSSALDVISHFFLIAAYLPLYSSIVILVFEGHFLLRSRATHGKIYATIIVYGLPALIWVYLVFFLFQMRLPTMSWSEIVGFVVSTVYVIMDVIVLIILVHLVSSKFRHGLLQYSMEALVYAIVAYSLADIFRNAMFFIVGYDVLKILPYVGYMISYMLFTSPSRTILHLEAKAKEVVRGV